MKIFKVFVFALLMVLINPVSGFADEKKKEGMREMMRGEMMHGGMTDPRMIEHNNMMGDMMGILKEVIIILKDVSHAPSDIQKKRLDEMIKRMDEMTRRQNEMMKMYGEMMKRKDNMKGK